MDTRQRMAPVARWHDIYQSQGLRTMGRVGSGVEIRASSIRIKFVLNGETIRERLTLDGRSLSPTPANIRYAERVAEDIRRRIHLGAFEYAEFFPDSNRLAKQASSLNDFGTLADLWLQAQGRLASSTKDQYATAVRFWKTLIGDKRLVSDIDHKFIAAKIGGHPWPSAKTHNNYLIALRGIFSLEYHGARSMLSPLQGIENMKTVKKLPDPFTIEERDRILADIAAHYDERIYAYFLWMFFTGMRPEEAIALRWSDIDLNDNIARVQRVRTFKGSERDGSKNHTVRDVDLLPQALDALRIMKPHTFMQKIEREKDGDNSADVFQNPVTGRPWHDERSQRDHYWRPALKRLGIRWRKAYNTRHTFATVALMTGAPPGYIAEQLGHSVKMLHEKYTRWMPENDKGRARDHLKSTMGSQAGFGTNSGTNSRF